MRQHNLTSSGISHNFLILAYADENKNIKCMENGESMKQQGRLQGNVSIKAERTKTKWTAVEWMIVEINAIKELSNAKVKLRNIQVKVIENTRIVK